MRPRPRPRKTPGIESGRRDAVLRFNEAAAAAAENETGAWSLQSAPGRFNEAAAAAAEKRLATALRERMGGSLQ